MKLEEIGFYTLEDKRAANVSEHSPLWRCELILTDACNFKCPYCRGLREDCAGTMPYEKARDIVALWTSQGLRNIRFSGGEPTLYKRLPDLVRQAKKGRVRRIAISTNGSNTMEYYRHLIDCGVNDFSVSLDACCSSVGDIMAGVTGSWGKVIDNIAELSKLTYVTVGVVFTDETIGTIKEVIEFAHNLGVADIRIISAAQFNEPIVKLEISDEILNAYPILKYRVDNFRKGNNVRGMSVGDNPQCPLVLDDMAVAGEFHFPCIIYLREGGDPTGRIDSGRVREERKEWFEKTNCHEDKICRDSCLEICIFFRNKVRDLNLIYK